MARIANYNRPKNTRRTLMQMLSYLGRHKWYMLMIALLVTVSASASILGTYLLKPVINNYIIPGDIPGLVKMLILMGILYLCGALSCYAYNQMMVHISQQVVSEIRSDLFVHTQRLPLTYFDAHTHGELMSRFTNDVDTISEALNSSFAMMIQSFITITGTLTMLLILSWQLSLIVMVFLALMILFIRFNGRRSRKYFVQQQKYLGSINGFVEEMVAGQKVEKVFNHEAQDYEEFCRRNEAFRAAATKALTYSGMTVPTIVSLSYINYALSACVGGLFALAGLTDLGTLASYLVYVRQSAMPMNQFTQQINFLLAALSGAERIFDMMNEGQELDEGSVTLCNVAVDENGEMKECSGFTKDFAWKVPAGVAVSADADPNASSFRLIPLKGDVRFNQVVFGYTSEKTILNGISLYAKPGQKIAFVGSTGAGKTTIINLVNRFYEINSGSITYDGIDIRNIKKDDLRRSLSMVIQDTHLFTGTIADNIRYGRLDAADEDVVNAAKVANAHSFIRRLPQGYDTMLHSDGSNLSQGQRQLLAIARAAISRPPVLILDEATSSIDTRTEKLIEKGMDALMDGRTVFVIAHRLSTVRNSKAIMVLEKGEIIERGNHDELLEQKGRYYQLYTGQFELE
ncbi:ABC transporter ATP-binding protein/permease [Enterocloster sp. OA13]|uniref:ABC transporter ATP-binding protein n=1 Tax=Enterocloster TaxID=2719313 RepID=UPI000470E1F9|nr:ABC transporter ATP-binding protein [Lachnoclostridium pacaense]MCC2815702.1 ABC transporter ATP-binding protein/permease [Lachnoclostridium pacaense]MCC2877815.1 ABC transporter ATP-binding protein/permease [Lachnoclostridium pacaense]MCH1950902.1 ABC transporter ATP-binding protein/permease [Enterocloster sp. OA13]